MKTTTAAIPTRVGECRWCQSNVFEDQPRLSRGPNVVWHRNCAVNEAHWLWALVGVPVDNPPRN